MIERMPVLCQNHSLKALQQIIDLRNDFIAACHCQGTAGAEIILHIDHDQSLIGWPHLRLR